MHRCSRYASSKIDFYPRPPGGGRLISSIFPSLSAKISIHALRVEGDCVNTNADKVVFDHFYPRPPGGGRPVCIDRAPLRFGISIHALRVEGDHCIAHSLCTLCYISIHALRVEGDPQRRRRVFLGYDISIHALRVEGDRHAGYNIKPEEISIHALRVEGDSLFSRFSKAVLQFLSTPSGWRATLKYLEIRKRVNISIHALRVEGDVYQGRNMVAGD